MEIVRHRDELRQHWGGVLVPTMGALHEGHLSLIDRARESGYAPVMVSVFVNPAQFNDPEDLRRYPRDPERDAAMCGERGADVVYIPGSAEDVYPEGVDAPFSGALPPVATQPGLEDAYRPGHFAGVCRVGTRLFELARPAAATFGEKDWQQYQTARQLIAAERLPVQIIPGPTVREPHGLAMSSRNELLSKDGRAHAGQIKAAMDAANEVGHPATAERLGRDRLQDAGFDVEYFVVRDAETLLAPEPGRAMRVLVAAVLEGIRLIDNDTFGD
ncbi:MAG: pantoate--beta-alanine ligase [Planctomycetota bacterium]